MSRVDKIIIDCIGFCITAFTVMSLFVLICCLPISDVIIPPHEPGITGDCLPMCKGEIDGKVMCIDCKSLNGKKYLTKKVNNVHFCLDFL